MTLCDLFKVFWTITEIDVTARDPDGHFLHEWKFGEGRLDKETIHEFHERLAGRLTFINKKVNHHGDPVRGGSEMGWGVNEKIFPNQILHAPLTHLSVMNRVSGEHKIFVDVEMHEMTVATILEDGRNKNGEG